MPEPGPHAHQQDAPARRIRVALILTLATMLVEVAGGLASGSLALISDAGHMMADAGALALALVAQQVAARPRTLRRTYGSRRAETLAAFVNGIVLGVTAVWVIVEAVERWRTPTAIDAPFMLAVAVAGLLANLTAAWVLSGRGAAHNANTRAALAHVLADAAGSAAAILAGVLVLWFGWTRADPAISVILALLILWSAWKLVAQTVGVLMEGAPAGVPLEELERTIRETPGVADLHDLHAWTISEGFDILTVHVVLDGAHHGTDVAREVGHRVRERHRIAHVTVQPEPPAVRPSLHPVAVLRRRRK
jgi:cobalt-zinc-cadmium efflux system protein